MEILIFVWILSGVICYALAKKKEKSGGIAFLMGVLFGFLAIIYYIIAKRGGGNCKFCAEVISKKAIVCPHCQSDLVEN